MSLFDFCKSKPQQPPPVGNWALIQTSLDKILANQKTILSNQNTIMATQAEEVAILTGLVTLENGTAANVATVLQKVTDLQTALANAGTDASPELVAAVQAVSDAANKTAAELNPIPAAPAAPAA